MVGWGRETPWRQGAVLPRAAIEAFDLGLPPNGSAGTIAVVISHDCDLAQSPEVEPSVEVPPCRCIATPNGNFTHGKNPRRLHLALNDHMRPIWLELEATRKRSIDKADLALHQPDPSHFLTPTQNCSATLAGRPVSPSSLSRPINRRLRNAGLTERLARILEKDGALLSAVLFDLDQGREVVRSSADDLYELTIYLVCASASCLPCRRRARSSRL